MQDAIKQNKPEIKPEPTHSQSLLVIIKHLRQYIVVYTNQIRFIFVVNNTKTMLVYVFHHIVHGVLHTFTVVSCTEYYYYLFAITQSAIYVFM